MCEEYRDTLTQNLKKITATKDGLKKEESK